MDLNDITTSITELPKDKSLDLIKERRQSRHTTKKSNYKKKKTSRKSSRSKPKKKKKTKLQKLLESVPPEKRDQILKEMRDKYK